jgi:hypothetical protein
VAKTQMKIWRCPLCEAGVRAPSKMRQDDARRYCLDCTASEGKLVERVCVARETAKRKAQEKVKAALERAKQTVKEELELWPWVLYTEYPNWQDLDAWDDKTTIRNWRLEVVRTKRECQVIEKGNRVFLVRATGDRGTTAVELLERMAWHCSRTNEEMDAAVLRAVQEITGVEVHGPHTAIKAMAAYFQQASSDRRSLPTPVRTRKRPKRKKSAPKTKIEKAFAKREKESEW